MTVEQCAELLRQQDDLLLVTHKNPDGDTVGSAAALCSALRRLGKTAWLYPNRELGKKLRPYAEKFFAPEAFEPRFVVAVDAAAEKLLARGFEGNVDCCIDHHPSNTRYAAALLLGAERASCGEIVFSLIQTLCGGVTKEEAELLYIAVSTDTGCFQYGNTDAHAHRTAAALIEAGAGLLDLNLTFFRRVSPARLMLEGMIYSSMRFYHGGELVIAMVTEDMLKKSGAVEDDLDDLAGLAGRAESARVSITIREKPGEGSKISARSGPEFDSCALCAAFGGGGHKMAAGCTIPLPPKEAREALLREIDRLWV